MLSTFGKLTNLVLSEESTDGVKQIITKRKRLNRRERDHSKKDSVQPGRQMG